MQDLCFLYVSRERDNLPRFYVDELQREENSIYLTGSDVNHIKNVLRLSVGDYITVCDGQGNDFYCIITRLTDEIVNVRIEETRNSEAELPTKIYLFQALPKADKMELIIQKAVELGVYEVIPVKTRRCVVKLPDERKVRKKLDRWQTISMSAAKQSGRGIIPKISDVMTFKEALAYADEMSLKLIPYENETQMESAMESMEKLKNPLASVAIFIGPEGGFEYEEIELAKAAGLQTISLGKRILRTETAGMMMISVMMFRLEKGI